MTSDPEIEAVVAGLTKAQRSELLAVREGDRGYLARGDQAGLARAGLSVPPMGQGFAYLSRLGLRVRQHLLGETA